MFKRLLSMLLVFSLIVSMCPVFATATTIEETTEQITMENETETTAEESLSVPETVPEQTAAEETILPETIPALTEAQEETAAPVETTAPETLPEEAAEADAEETVTMVPEETVSQEMELVNEEYAGTLVEDIANRIVIGTSGGYLYYQFTPSETANYTFYSLGNYRTSGWILDPEGNYVSSSNYARFGSNFCETADLEAGVTYTMGIQCNYTAGTFDVFISKSNIQTLTCDTPVTMNMEYGIPAHFEFTPEQDGYYRIWEENYYDDDSVYFYTMYLRVYNNSHSGKKARAYLESDTTYLITVFSNNEEEVELTFCAEPCPAAESIAFRRDSYNAYTGRDLYLNIDYTPDYALEETIGWYCSDPTVLAVPTWTTTTGDSVSCLRPGTAEVTVTTLNNLSAKCTVTVRDPQTISVGFSESVTLQPEEDLIYLFTPEESGTYYFYDELDPNLSASVTDNADYYEYGYEGVVFEAEAGKTYQIFTENYSYTAEKNLTVHLEAYDAPQVESMTLETYTNALYPNQNVSVYLSVYPEDVERGTITWEADSDLVSFVNRNNYQCMVKFTDSGTATITATAENGVSASITLTAEDTETISLGQRVQKHLDYEESVGFVFTAPETAYYVLQEENGYGASMMVYNPDGTGVSGDEALYINATAGETYVITVEAYRSPAVEYSFYLSKCVPLEGIALNYTSAVGVVGDRIYLESSFVPLNGTPETVLWTADNQLVSLSDYQNRCTVELLGIGQAIVTATTSSGYTARCVINITTAKEISVGFREQLYLEAQTSMKYSFTPETDGEYIIRDTSNNSCYFNVTCNGSYVAGGSKAASFAGTAGKTYEIEVENNYTSLNQYYNIALDECLPVESLTLSSYNTTGMVGDSLYLTLQATPSNSMVKNVVWSSSDSSIARIRYSNQSSASITLEGAGTAVITATVGELTASLTVKAFDYQDIKLGDTVEVTLKSGEFQGFRFTAEESGTYVMWDTSGDSNTTFELSTESGSVLAGNSHMQVVIEAEAGSTYLLKAKPYMNNQEYTAKLSLDKAAPVESLDFAEARICTFAGTDYLEAVYVNVTPYNAACTKLAWSSDDTGIVSVSQDTYMQGTGCYLTPEGAGSTVVRVTDPATGISASVDVHVQDMLNAQLDTPYTVSMEYPESYSYINFVPELAGNCQVQVDSDAEVVVSISSRQDSLNTYAVLSNSTQNTLAFTVKKDVPYLLYSDLTDDAIGSYTITITQTEAEIDDTCGWDATWEFDESTGTLTISGTGEMYDYAGKLVPWNTIRDSIQFVVVEDGITGIGDYAFRDCTSLKQISLADSVKSLGDAAFHGCSALENVEIPSGVTAITYAAFADCTSLAAVSLPEKLTEISHFAFYNSGLTELSIPASVLSIPEYAFSFCDNLASVTLSRGLQSIRFMSFFGSGLGAVSIPDTVTELGYGAFANCVNLAEAKLPADLQSVGECSFTGCSSLTEANFPEKMTTVGPGAYADCTGLTSLRFPASVAEIGYKAFDGCTGVTSITFDNCSPVMGEYSFGSVVADASYDADDPRWTTDKLRSYGGTINWIGSTEVAAEGICGDDLVWKFYESTGALVISGTGAMYDYRETGAPWGDLYESVTSIVIEEGVTSIGSLAFSFMINVTQVQIADTVTDISEKAFLDCMSLEQVSFGSGLVHVGKDAFIRTAVTNLTFPDSLETLGDGAFGSCTNLSQVTFPANLQSIGQETFGYCSNLKKINIPNSVTELGYAAFGSCTSLQEVTLPDSLPSIGEYTFKQCSSLRYLNFADATTAIGTGTFAECTGLTSVYLPEGVTSVGNGAFEDCTGLVILDFPESLNVVEQNAFAGCSGLKDVLVPANVTEIQENAFGNCEALTHISFAGNVPQIGADSFGNVTATAFYPEGNETWTETVMQDYGGSITWQAYKKTDSENSCGDNATWVFDAKTGTLTVSGAGPMGNYNRSLKNRPWEALAEDIRSVVIEKGITTIGDFAFHTCPNLTSVSIPGSVHAINWNAFCECENLAEITIPEGVDTIEMYAFDSCAELTTVSLPSTLTEIGYGAFYRCGKIQSIELPESLTVIGNNAFNGCYRVQSITIPASVTTIGSYAFSNLGIHSIVVPETVTELGSFAFSSCGDLTEAHLPENMTKVPYGLFYYNEALTEITVSENLTEIGGRAFDRCSGLVNFEIPETVTTIGGEAFSGCTAWTGSKLPSGLTTLESGAFEYCPAIQEMTIPAGITQLSSGVFRGCRGLERVTLPESMTSIGEEAFAWCSSLPEIKIPEAVTSIGAKAFYECTSLPEIILPDGITCINDSTFSGCTSLSGMLIPDAVTSIGNYAFSGCTDLETITLSSQLTSLGEFAFSGCTSLGAIEIPEGVTMIRNNTFTDCAALTEVSLPESLTAIDLEAFENCTTLPELHIPANVDTISETAFLNCSAMETITVAQENTSFTAEDGILYNDALTQLHYYPAGKTETSHSILESVTAVGPYAFNYSSNLDTVLIPSSVVKMGERAFYHSSVTSMTIPATLQTLDAGIFESSALESVTYESGAVHTGESIFKDCQNLTRVNLPDTLNYIDSSAFAGCTSLQHIDIPGKVTTIGFGSFQGCTELTDLVIPNSVMDIGMYAFESCVSLTELVLPQSVKWISSYAFNSCTGLKEVTICGDIETVSEYSNPFSECTNLKTVTFAPGVSRIARGILYEASSVVDIRIPKSVMSIGMNAFYGCSSLPVLTIPVGVASIGSGALANCDQLSALHFLGDAPAIEDDALTGTTVLACYPADNETWTEDVRQNYGGNVNWAASTAVQEGADAEVIMGNTLTVRAENEMADFVAAYVDSVLVDPSSYTVTEGSTVVTFHAEYLKTLDLDTHALCLTFADGMAATTFTMKPDLFSVYGANMTLGNSLAMNFWLQTSDLDGTDYYAEVTKSYADGRDDVTVTIPYSKWTSSGNMMYFTFEGMAAKEMADGIFVTIYKNDGTQASEVWTDSVKAYVMRNIAKWSGETLTMGVDMLNYGAAAQNYFGYGTSSLANADLGDYQQYATTSVNCEDSRVKGDNYVGSALTLESKIILTMYFNNLSSDMTAQISFTDHYGNAKNVTIPGTEFEVNGSMYGIIVDDLVVADGSQLVTCNVYDTAGNVVASATDSVESYVARMSSLDNLFQQIMKFSTSSYNYFH